MGRASLSIFTGLRDIELRLIRQSKLRLRSLLKFWAWPKEKFQFGTLGRECGLRYDLQLAHLAGRDAWPRPPQLSPSGKMRRRRKAKPRRSPQMTKSW